MPTKISLSIHHMQPVQPLYSFIPASVITVIIPAQTGIAVMTVIILAQGETMVITVIIPVQGGIMVMTVINPAQAEMTVIIRAPKAPVGVAQSVKRKK